MGANGAGQYTEMPRRPLGQTGEQVSMIGLGGAHIGELPAKDAVNIIRAAIDRGLNFMDNSWDYHEGGSEERLGKALKDGYRARAFVMTKVDGRTQQAAAKQIDESLKRLRVEYIDLLQHHEIIRFDDADRIFCDGGAHEAFLAAKEAGKIRYIGFTGHKDPHIHLYMLDVAKRNHFKFDTVQMPINPFDAHFRSFGMNVVPVALEKGAGILGMKSMGSGVILRSGVVTAEECLRYALTLPTSVVITGIDSMEILDQACRVAGEFQPLSDAEMSQILAKTREAARHGHYELFKTTAHFDSTAQKPEWLGDEPEWAKDLTSQ
jgi:predicted aldo/keto reductase-like oxidoreductase